MSEKKRLRQIKKGLNRFGFIPKAKRKTAFEVRANHPDSKVKTTTYYPNRRTQ